MFVPFSLLCWFTFTFTFTITFTFTLTLLPTISAFTSTSSTSVFSSRRRRRRTRTPRGRSIIYCDKKNNEDPGEESPFDAEEARERLESLLRGEDTQPKNANGNPKILNMSLPQLLKLKSNDFLASLPPPPPLSAIERDRRTTEIRILERLEDGDEASADLWSLWYSERGATARSVLDEADRLLGDPASWRDCEAKLKRLVDDYGVYFVEPVNRLATLYYLQGRLDESYRLCQIILEIKPWP